MSTRAYLSIGDVLSLLREEFPDVTISKIRFLESQGLVNPERSPSGYRKFYEPDVERLRWVLRQQREHFLPLKVIRDRLAQDGHGGNGAAAPARPTPERRPPVQPVPAVVGAVAALGDRHEPLPVGAGGGEARANGALAVRAEEGPLLAASFGVAGGAPVLDEVALREPAGVGAVAAAGPGQHQPLPWSAAATGDPGTRPGAGEPGAADAPGAVSGGAAGAVSAGAAGGPGRTDRSGGGALAAAERPGSATGPGAAPAPGTATSRAAVTGIAAGAPAPAGAGSPAGEAATPGLDGGSTSAAAGTPASPGAGEPVGGPTPAPDPISVATGAAASGPVAVAPVAPAVPAPGQPARPAPSRAAQALDPGSRGGNGAPGIATGGASAGGPGRDTAAGSGVGAAGRGLAAGSGPDDPAATPGDLTGASLTLEELCAASGLDPAGVAALEGFGLVEPMAVAGILYYDEEALVVARLVAGFSRFGIEPRHLRLYRNAVDREMGLIEQVVTPLLRQRNPESRQRAVDSAAELAKLGQGLRSSLLRRELRRQLGS